MDDDIGKQLGSSPFKPRRGRPQKYPWEQWENGSAWEIERGRHYDIASENMQVNLHMRAARDNLEVATERVKTEGGREGVRFQFFSSRESGDTVL